VTHSALYEGRVRHSRRVPRPHAFSYRVYLMYLDLDELPRLFERRWLWSSERPNLCWFRRADYMAPADRPLREVVLDRVERELGRRPTGPVRVLTQLRTFGYVFNPVTFYYCHDEQGQLAAVAAEITNTPWGERHTYVLDARAAAQGDVTRTFRKQFHVSPFFGMDLDYAWRFTQPAERLEIHMRNQASDQTVFEASLVCERRPLDGRTLALSLLRHPLLTLRVHAAIYLQAALLWAKRMPFHAHPRKTTQISSPRAS
jgi:DUF1365 family protein